MTRFWITLDQGIGFVLDAFRRMQGGEIFIPKIPSVKILDLAKSVSPNGTHHTIGIRPGEKMHEVMCPADDARLTLEFEDHYVIQPSFGYWSRPAYLESAKPVAENFRYASDNNTQWLDADTLRKLIG